MSNEDIASGLAKAANAGVILGWDDVFGLHLQVRGGPAAAARVANELEEAGFEATTQADGAERLKREGCELVFLFADASNVSHEGEVRALLLEKGHVVEPAEGVERVPCPYGERLRPLLRRGSYFEDAKPATATELGLTAEDGAELMRMAADPEFDKSWNTDAVWAPAWAWVLLGELKPPGAEAVLLGLLDKLDTDDGDDAATEILPNVFGRMGPAVAPALVLVLRDEARKNGSRWVAADGLKEIALARPETRAEMVAILTAQLEEQAVRDETINAAIISDLIDLKAVESAAVIERAFRAGRVDETVAGDWDEVQVYLGLKKPTRFVPETGRYGAAPVRRETPKVGRNDPCPCGSGKKFKKCCGA